MAAKVRLDKLLVDRALAPSREKAEAYIMAGVVLVNDQPQTKAGIKLDPQVEIRLTYVPGKFVGRGGDKIDSVFDHFKLDLTACIALDVGASTGGFTDSMLQRGAERVYAVDVGYNQLALGLRQDPRVVVHEKTNAKDLKPEMFNPRPNFATIDVSFIGLRKVLAPVAAVLQAPFQILALVKPQFELEPEAIGKGGVVREQSEQQRAVNLVKDFSTQHLKLDLLGDLPAPIRGEKKGNQEYFILLKGTLPFSSV